MTIGDTVLVAVTGVAGGDQLLRSAADLARRSDAALVGVHVRTARGRDAATPHLDTQSALLGQLGGGFREVVADSVAAGLLASARAERAGQIVLGAQRRSRLAEAFRPSVITEVVRGAGGDVDVHVITTPAGPPGLPRAPYLGVLSARRRLAGFALTAVGLVVVTALLAPEAGLLGLRASTAPQVTSEALTTPLLLYLALTATVAAIGGLWPGLTCAVAGVVLGNAVFTQPRGNLSVASGRDLVALVVFLLIAVLVSTLTDLVVRRAAQTNRARAEVRVLTRLAATIPAVEDPLARLTEEIRALFDLEGVALVRQTAADRWITECWAGDAPDHPDQADDSLRVDSDRLLLLRGPRAPAEDRRLLAAVVTQLAVAATRRSLTETATALRQVTAANDLRTALLSAVSHDLRTPLASIKAAASSLLAHDVDLSPDLVQEFAQTIVADTDRLNRLITNLLDMSRLQAGATEPLMQPTGVDEVVALAVDHIPVRQLEIRVPATLPEVWADPALLERVVANLVDNAVKVSRGTHVVVRAMKVPEGVAIHVIDHGPGIPPGAIEEVFKPFQRLGDAPRGRGVGLGLAIAKGFTDAMDGNLRVTSTAGGGTTMVLTLPTTARTASPETQQVAARG